MDFSWSEEQMALRRRIAEFAEAELNGDILADDLDGRFRRDLWRKCADFGLLRLVVPEASGGEPAHDLMTAVLAMEGLGYGCEDNGLPFGLNAQTWAIQLPIYTFGTEEQKARYLPGLCDGTLIGAHGLTEPDAGSDAFSLSTVARKVEGGYRLTGAKRLVTFAPIADLTVLFATINPDLGRWGITGFIIDTKSEGFTAKPVNPKMGLRTIPIGEFELEDCFVPEENRLGPEGAGVSISTHSLQMERCCILASQLGRMERQLETAVAYARERQQYGKPIGNFQSVSNRIADMKLRLETARLLLYKVAWLVSEGRPATMESSLLKLYLSETFVDSSLDTIRIHGGHGYLTETGVERDLRDAIAGILYAGTSDIQRNLISRLLGL